MQVQFTYSDGSTILLKFKAIEIIKECVHRAWIPCFQHILFCLSGEKHIEMTGPLIMLDLPLKRDIQNVVTTTDAKVLLDFDPLYHKAENFRTN
jgi:hypothetical protein